MRKEGFKPDDPMVPAVEEAVSKLLDSPIGDKILAISFPLYNFDSNGYIEKDTLCCSIDIDIPGGYWTENKDECFRITYGIDEEILAKYGLHTGTTFVDLDYTDVFLYKKGDIKQD